MKGSLAASLLLCVALPASAGIATKKVTLAPANGAQDVSVEVDKVRVSQVQFPDKQEGPDWFSKGGYTLKVRVDNNGAVDQEVGVAVVFYDADGNVVAAGTGGTKMGYLNKGDRDTHSIDFNYVFRHARKATSFSVTLETKARAKTD